MSQTVESSPTPQNQNEPSQNVDPKEGCSTSENVEQKTMVPRSEVWLHFTKVELVVNGIKTIRAKCKYCPNTSYKWSSGEGTSNLWKHLNKCSKYPHKTPRSQECKQSNLNFSPSTKEGDASLVYQKYNAEVIRKGLSYMVIVDELPFKFVENKGFKYFCSVMQPRFQVPSRFTVARDCYEMYLSEKEKLKSFMKKCCQRVCLTTDTWTSLQQINYMVLTAHFVDNDWKLHKRILNFCPISSHKGEMIGKAIEKCLLDWEVDRVFTITVDNASSNDQAIAYMKRKLNNWGGCVLNGDFLHVRCVAHIINLVVQDGLKEISDSIVRVRQAVRYVKQSPARLQKFKKCIEEEKIQTKKMLCLDVPTRWNSTYLMLDASHRLRNAFERFDVEDPYYEHDLQEREGKGKPTEEDWENVKRLVGFLRSFYDFTLSISGSLYVTSNSFLHEVSSIDDILREWCVSDDFDLSVMAKRMREKYNKYWGKPEKLNMLLYVSVVLDPRYKLEYVEFVLGEMYEETVAKMVLENVKCTLSSLINEYKSGLPNTQVQQPDLNEAGMIMDVDQPAQKMKLLMKHRFKKHKFEKDSGDSKSELDKFLDEESEKDNPGFEILSWWKVNSSRFPILSQIARDVLPVPISTVSSESAFSTGGRILDPFRSSLSPRVVEALVCTQDWLRSSPHPINYEERMEDIEAIEQGK
jgi:hypothetical protein